MLIIKKTSDYQVQKNIGRMFRRYNIVEYKSPGDYLSINDFYIGCAYVCLYKVDTAMEDERKIGEITLTFAAAKYPRKLIAHLTKERGYNVEEAEQGIYYVRGAFVPIQILVLSRLSEKENLWLRVLSNELKEKEIAGRALAGYRKHQNNGRYSNVIEIMLFPYSIVPVRSRVRHIYRCFPPKAPYACRAGQWRLRGIRGFRHKTGRKRVGD